MKVEIEEVSVVHFCVTLHRMRHLGPIGRITGYDRRPFKFQFTSDLWMKLTYDENTAILAAVEPKVTLLNITRRLTK